MPFLSNGEAKVKKSYMVYSKSHNYLEIKAKIKLWAPDYAYYSIQIISNKNNDNNNF